MVSVLTGALDTTRIEIVPKNRVNEYIIVKKPAKIANQPFEQTFRLQVREIAIDFLLHVYITHSSVNSNILFHSHFRARTCM